MSFEELRAHYVTMHDAGSSEMLVTLYQTSRRRITQTTFTVTAGGTSDLNRYVNQTGGRRCPFFLSIRNCLNFVKQPVEEREED